jgi:hypothetical protein
MTTREEAKAKIDAMDDAAFAQIADLLEAREAKLEAEASELERLLRILAEPLPTEEQQDLLNDLKRRPFRAS